MARGGSLQKAGFAAQALAFVALALNAIFPGVGSAIASAGQALNIGTGTVSSVAGVLTVAGTALQIAGNFLTPFEPPEPSDDRRQSPTYGFNPDNPPKGDAPLPAVFGTSLVRPVRLQAWTTPRGYEADEEFGKALKQRGQSVSVLFGVACDHVQDIDDIRVNNEPVFQQRLDVDGNPVALTPSPNGSRTKWTISGKRLDLYSMRVFVDGVRKGWNKSTKTERLIVAPNLLLYTIRTPEHIRDDEELVFRVDGETLTPSSARQVNAWLADEKTLHVNTQEQWPVGTVVEVDIPTWDTDGLTIERKQGDIQVTFDTAPTTSEKLTYTVRRETFPGLQTYIRLGGRHQLPIPGFGDVRQSHSLGGAEIVKGAFVEFETEDDVDDVIIDITSSSGGFTRYDKVGDRDPAEAQFIIEYRKSSDTVWTRLGDPGGAKSGPTLKKNADEFRVRADSTAQVIWSFSIGGLLRNLNRKRPSKKHRDQLAAFTRDTYRVRLKRTNPIQANSNGRHIDRIFALSRQEVQEEFLSRPGTAHIGLHGIGSQKLNGRFPITDCVVTGFRNVKKWNGSAWVVDADAHKNNVWAVCRLLTSYRYGLGHAYNLEDNVDAASAKAAADWCDETVELGEGETEVRARLDVTLDTRSSFQAWARDLLLPAQVIPVWHGDVLSFVIDGPVDLDEVQSYTADEVDARVFPDDLQAGHEDEADRVEELEVVYFDESERYERRPFRVVPETATIRRTKRRLDLLGCTRRTQAERVAEHIHQQAHASPPRLSGRITLAALRHEAGDVFQIESTELGLTGRYWRCEEISLPRSNSTFVTFQAREYVPSHYGQTIPTVILDERTPGASPLALGSRRSQQRRFPVTARRLA